MSTENPETKARQVVDELLKENLSGDKAAAYLDLVFSEGPLEQVVIQTNMGQPLKIVEIWREGGTLKISVE